jgi:hypothetical protein
MTPYCRRHCLHETLLEAIANASPPGLDTLEHVQSGRARNFGLVRAGECHGITDGHRVRITGVHRLGETYQLGILLFS